MYVLHVLHVLTACTARILHVLHVRSVYLQSFTKVLTWFCEAICLEPLGLQK
jgi:hypothetical protein